MNIEISRRDVLLGSGALIVSFSPAGPLSEAMAQAGAKPVALTEVDSFLAIDKVGNVTVYSGKVDLGTGVPRRCARSWRRSSTCQSAVSS